MTIKKTVLLDDASIKILKEYGYTTSGSNSLSAAIRTIAKLLGKEYNDKRKVGQHE